MNSNLVKIFCLVLIISTGFEAARIRSLSPYCVEPPRVVFECFAYIPSWRYDQQLDACVSFIYGGCGRDSNTFTTLHECTFVCQPNGNGEEREDTCLQPKMTGPCFGYFPRWHYNAKSKQCEEFTYSGCDGNKNNFETEDECKARCPKKD